MKVEARAGADTEPELADASRYWWALLRRLSWPQWRHHGTRHASACLALALGVALAFAVNLINASALAEFAGAVRAVNGQPDVQLVARDRAGFDDDWFERIATDTEVAAVSPLVEFDSVARRSGQGETTPRSLHVIGIDALRVAALAPALLPHADVRAASRLALIDPAKLFLNPAAQSALGVQPGQAVELHSAQGWRRFEFAGTVAVGGAALAVIDIAAAQSGFDFAGRLSRIDVRLHAGIEPEAWLRRMALDATLQVRSAESAELRVSNLSRAYRVNLSVLAMVALLVGGFLVYSVLALEVAQRTPELALLGVLGLGPRQRRVLLLLESAALGAAGSAIGIALGTALAWWALRRYGGDLGGGYFGAGTGAVPALQWSWAAAAAHGLLGIAAAMAGAWWPARAAERMAPAQALKGLGSDQAARARVWPGLVLLALGAVLALLPPIAGMPIAAYGSVAAWVAAGVALVPALVQLVLALPGSALVARHAGVLLALERARFARASAGAAVAGVVASLSLCVALTVMVASFRAAVIDWLDAVLPAQLYLRSASSASASAQVPLADELVAQVKALPGVVRVQATRTLPLPLDPQQPAPTLMARPLQPAGNDSIPLPLVGAALEPRAGEIGVYVSEPLAAIRALAPGDRITLPLARGDVSALVLGVFRDYARQFGAVAIDAQDYRRLSGDSQVNDLAVWLAPGADVEQARTAIRRLAGDAQPLDLSSSGELRALSLRIFDRSFAVTRVLQAVAIAIGLVGVATSLAAQVLARRKEFGLLAHLGLRRRQILAIVGGESAAWLGAGCAIGVALGLALGAVLVHVVNPQSFHWRMELLLPWASLGALAGAVWVLGIAASLAGARHASGMSAVLAVKEDW